MQNDPKNKESVESITEEAIRIPETENEQDADELVHEEQHAVETISAATDIDEFVHKFPSAPRIDADAAVDPDDLIHDHIEEDE